MSDRTEVRCLRHEYVRQYTNSELNNNKLKQPCFWISIHSDSSALLLSVAADPDGTGSSFFTLPISTHRNKLKVELSTTLSVWTNYTSRMHHFCLICFYLLGWMPKMGVSCNNLRATPLSFWTPACMGQCIYIEHFGSSRKCGIHANLKLVLS